MKYKKYWIRRGTNGFTYDNYDYDVETRDFSCELPPDFTQGDDFYDAILEEPAIGGTEVIEIGALDEALKLLKISNIRLNICLGRMKACQGVGHEVSEIEIPGWVEQTNEFLKSLGEKC